MASAYPLLHLRQEQKPLEHRSFSPAVIRSLISAGYTVHVERSSTDSNYVRIFQDSEYVSAGATLVPEASWPEAAPGTIILGLKELPEQDFPLRNDHITFAHCYKNQGGWERVLSRWPRGGSTLYDLEFLVDEQGRRVSAFGYHAGFTGAALAIKAWAWQLTHPGKEMPGLGESALGREFYLDEEELLTQVKSELQAACEVAKRSPRAMVMGALGRCGRGAVDFFTKVGVKEGDITKWDLAETKDRHGPYEEIVQHDIFLNAIYLSDPIPPFVDMELLAKPGRTLSVVCDVSCDTTNPHNPIPIYSINTTFTKPTVAVDIPNSKTDLPLWVISIDHLPSMLPREASEAFSEGLKESLLSLKDRDSTPVWTRAKQLFNEKVALLPAQLRTREA